LNNSQPKALAMAVWNRRNQLGATNCKLRALKLLTSLFRDYINANETILFANALNPARRSPAAANPCTGSERRPAGNLLPMVPWDEIGGASDAKGNGIETPAPGLNRSPSMSLAHLT
jgi:hypothetical protein